MSDIKYTVSFPEARTVVRVSDGANLLRVIRDNGLDIEADCGGRGRCLKCGVIVDGEKRFACDTAVKSDMSVVIPYGGSNTYRILTDSEPRGGADVGGGVDGGMGSRLFSDGDCFAIAVDIGTTTVVAKLIGLSPGDGGSGKSSEGASSGDGGSGKSSNIVSSEVAVVAELNEQRPYGADVISRINLSMDDASVLSGIIREQVDRMITRLIENSGADCASVERITIAGNTTMCYLLLGLPCRSLGLAPFEPRFTFESEYSYDEVFGAKVGSANADCANVGSANADCANADSGMSDFANAGSGRSGCANIGDAKSQNKFDAPVYVLPFISSFIGSDITAGLLALDPATAGSMTEGNADEPIILVDMGTNGEIVYRSGDRLLCTATAAGPAFEGGNISCGSGSVEGAISKVFIEEKSDGSRGFSYETIGGAPARSICGSGILDVMACFKSEGIINASGAFNKNSPFYTEEGVVIAEQGDVAVNSSGAGPQSGRTSKSVNSGAGSSAGSSAGAKRIVITQKDVREFQLAKSAVRSGIEVLISEFDGNAPNKLYLAGGFGQHLDPESAFQIGLIPESLRGRVVPAGNSSLAGAAIAAICKEHIDRTSQIVSRGEEINLAAHHLFNKFFMDYMMF